MSYCILAKGRSDNYMSLFDHTNHVVQSIAHFAKQYGVDADLAIRGAILHDLGKAHPAFQAMLIDRPDDGREEWLAKLPASHAIRDYLDQRDDGVPAVYRHELGSLGFLSLFDEKEWPAYIEMIVAHHKSIRKDKSKRGFLDLADNKFGDGLEIVAADHLAYWEDWSPAALEVVEQFGLPAVPISIAQAERNFQYAFEYVRDLGPGRSHFRGLLMSADHFGSAFKDEAGERASKLFGQPDHSSFIQRKNSERAHLYPLSKIATDDPRPHTIVTAPTGAGKTDFLVNRCRGRIFYTLPFQASINSMHKRFVSDMPDADVRRLHSASKVNFDLLENKEGDQYHEDIDLQQHPGAAVKVLTPHQLVALALCTPGHEAIALDVRGQDVILDEVHTYSDESRMMIIKIVQVLLKLDCRIHIGTATLPKWLREKLHGMLGGGTQVQSVSLPHDVLDTFDRHIIHKTYDGVPLSDDSIEDIVKTATAAGEKVLVVVNRVRRAQDLYIQLKQSLGAVPIVLIHSRYRRIDRAQLENEIIALQIKERTGPAIAIATQVVEVSLDISFDRMITDAAPLDALVQRFGRVNRRRSAATIGNFRPIHVLPPPKEEKEALPYSLSAVERSYDILPDGKVLQERNVQAMMDQVFSDPEEHVVSTDYKVAEDGSCQLRKLQHQPRSTVISVLNIEGYTCVTDEDSSEYRQANCERKSRFEIPVGKSFARYGLTVEESGSYPFILPNDKYYFTKKNKLGLRMEEIERPVENQFL